MTWLIWGLFVWAALISIAVALDAIFALATGRERKE
jgi:hypothetical protein